MSEETVSKEFGGEGNLFKVSMQCKLLSTEEIQARLDSLATWAEIWLVGLTVPRKSRYDHLLMDSTPYNLTMPFVLSDVSITIEASGTYEYRLSEYGLTDVDVSRVLFDRFNTMVFSIMQLLLPTRTERTNPGMSPGYIEMKHSPRGRPGLELGEYLPVIQDEKVVGLSRGIAQFRPGSWDSMLKRLGRPATPGEQSIYITPPGDDVNTDDPLTWNEKPFRKDE